MIHFDFEDRYQDELVVGSAISRREGVVWSGVLHALLIALLLYLPQLPIFQPSPEEIEQQRLEQLAREQNRDRPVFVMVEPQLDLPAEQVRERFEMSDQDRRSQTRERAPTPRNPMPFSQGNTAERSEAADAQQPRGEDVPPQPAQPDPAPPPPPQPEQQIARNEPPPPIVPPRPDSRRPRAPGSIIGDAVRNLERYTQNQTFNNPQGGSTDPGAAIQFDTKGVEFGPWLRRFVSQVRRNWFVPLSAMSFRGHVVLQFNIHRDGRITDVDIVKPSDIDSFNRAAFNAIIGSNPTEPLPPEYPDDKVLFTVTFYYNEQPGS